MRGLGSQDDHIALPTKPGLGFEIEGNEAEQDCGVYEEELGGVLLGVGRQRGGLGGLPWRDHEKKPSFGTALSYVSIL